MSKPPRRIEVLPVMTGLNIAVDFAEIFAAFRAEFRSRIDEGELTTVSDEDRADAAYLHACCAEEEFRRILPHVSQAFGKFLRRSAGLKAANSLGGTQIDGATVSFAKIEKERGDWRRQIIDDFIADLRSVLDDVEGVPGPPRGTRGLGKREATAILLQDEWIRSGLTSSQAAHKLQGDAGEDGDPRVKQIFRKGSRPDKKMKSLRERAKALNLDDAALRRIANGVDEK